MRARGAKSDLHSSLATIVPNPAWRLVWALSTLKDEDDHITIDGFMDYVAEPTPAEMKMLEVIPFEEERIKERFGIPGANVHAPNENIRLTDYFEGIRFIGELLRRFSAAE